MTYNMQEISDIEMAELADKYHLSLVTKEDFYGYKPQIMIFGGKGAGKTSLAFMAQGTKFVLNYDGKARIIKKKFVDMDPKNKELITIREMTDPTDPRNPGATSPELILNIGERIVEASKFYIANSHSDWIIFDSVDILSDWCELYMRKSQGLRPYQGIKDRNVWKERNAYINQLVNLAVTKARLGVIYTGFERIIELDDFGEITKITMPAWVARIKDATDFVIYARKKMVSGEEGETNSVFYATVMTSKDNAVLIDGKTYDTTDYKPIINPLGVEQAVGYNEITSFSESVLRVIEQDKDNKVGNKRLENTTIENKETEAEAKPGNTPEHDTQLILEETTATLQTLENPQSPQTPQNTQNPENAKKPPKNIFGDI